MARVNLKGLHMVRPARGADEYHYAYRGGPCIWKTGGANPPGTPEYINAYLGAHGLQPAAAPRTGGTLRGLILEYYASKAFQDRAPRTKKEYEYGLRAVDERWGSAPLSAVEHPDFRASVVAWIDANWTSKAADHRLTPFKRVLSWGYDTSEKLKYNHLAGVPLYYCGSNRAEISWLNDEIEEFCKTAPEWLARPVGFMSETAFRPGDLVRCSKNHVQDTPLGERVIILRTNKSNRKRVAQVPVTQRAAKIIDSTPADQLLILRPPRASS